MCCIEAGKQAYPYEQSFQIQEEYSSKSVTIFVFELCLLGKGLIEVECNLETVGNEGKSALLNTKETAILHDFVILSVSILSTFMYRFR